MLLELLTQLQPVLAPPPTKTYSIREGSQVDRVLEVLDQAPAPLSYDQLIVATGFTRNSLCAAIHRLKKADLVEVASVEPGRTNHRVRFRATI